MIVIDCPLMLCLTSIGHRHRLHLPSAISDKEKSCQCFFASVANRFLFGVLFSVLILLFVLDTIVVFQIYITPDFRIRFSVAQEAYGLDGITFFPQNYANLHRLSPIYSNPDIFLYSILAYPSVIPLIKSVAINILRYKSSASFVIPSTSFALK